MFLSTEYPGINTSPQSQLEKQLHNGSIENRRSQDQNERHTCENYDGDESDLEDNYSESGIEGNMFHGSHFRRSLPDLGPSTPTSSTNPLNEAPVKARLKKKVKQRRSEPDLTLDNSFKSGGRFNGVKNFLNVQRSGAYKPLLASTPVHLQEDFGSVSFLSFLDVPFIRAHLDLGNSLGKRRGVSGSSITSPLDVSLFYLFYFTDAFDEYLLDERIAQTFPSKEAKVIRETLRKNVLYSLRTSYFSPESFGKKIFSLIVPNWRDLNFSKISYQHFLRHFLSNVLTVPELIHYSNGTSELIHQIQLDAALSGEEKYVPRYPGPFKLFSGPRFRKIKLVQELFARSLGDAESGLKLLAMPSPALFLSMKRGKERALIVPNMQLDMDPILMQIEEENETEDQQETDGRLQTQASNARKIHKSENPSNQKFCKCLRSFGQAVYEVLQDFVEQFPVPGGAFSENSGFLDDSFTEKEKKNLARIADHQHSENERLIRNFNEIEYSVKTQASSVLTSRKQTKRNKGKLQIALDLMAIVCEEGTSEGIKSYSAFVRCGNNPRRGWAPWAEFRSFERQEENAGLESPIPSVKKVEDFGKWMKRLEKGSKGGQRDRIEEDNFRKIPEDIKRVLDTGIFYVYSVKPDYESQNTLFSCTKT